MKVRLHFLSGPLANHYLDVPETVVLGRQPGFGVVIADPTASSEHCRVTVQEGRAWVEDLGSANGTQVNGQAVTTAELSDGAEVLIGESRLRVELLSDESAAAPSAIASTNSPADSAAVPPEVGEAPVEVEEQLRECETGESGRRQDRPRTRIIEHAPQAPGGRTAPAAAHRGRWVVGLAAGVLIAVILALSFRGCEPEARNMLSKTESDFARRQFERDGVRLTIQEPVGLARKAEPVTSGVPLPEGSVMDAGRLSLKDSAGAAIPCQFTVLSRWPYSAQGATKGKSDGSIKWVLLDFQADVGASQKVEYVLCRGGGSAKPIAPVRTTQAGDTLKLETLRPGSGQAGNLKSRETRDAKRADIGNFRLGVSSNAPGLIHELEVDGRVLVSRENPLQTTLVDASNRVYRASKPDSVVVEVAGPMRTTVRVSGHYVSEDGGKIFGGKVGYDVRFTAYAGRSDVRVDFTFKNDGWYGYRNEGKGHPRQWLYFRELRLDVPIDYEQPKLMVGRTNGLFAAGDRVAQWLSYPQLNMRSQREVDVPEEMELAYDIWPNMFTRPKSGLYWASTAGTNMTYGAGLLPGYAQIADSFEKPGVTVAVRRFSENYPRGFELGQGQMRFLMLPRGGYWPRTPEAIAARTYQFEGGRRKTIELLLSLGDGPAAVTRLNSPLFARAEPGWYRDTGAVLPMPGAKPQGLDLELDEAWERYDRLQRAKVNSDYGDPAGPIGADVKRNKVRFKKVSYPGLKRMAPEVFMGWMNYGDLVWGFGYVSLYYQWPYSMLQNYLRLGDREFFDTGEDMIRHRYDIDQYHVENTAPYLGGFQRYEKGEHGHLQRQKEAYGPKVENWEMNCRPSHTWNRDLLLHWALTGDPRSLAAAEQNGRAYARFFESNKNWVKTNHVEYGEFRTPGWAMENYLALYEYTGQPQWLARAEQVFDKTLLAMERANGCKGHILKGGKQDAQFVAYIAEPVCRLHHYTHRADVIEFLDRVLTFQKAKNCLPGREKDGTYIPTRWQTGEWDASVEDAEEGVSPVYSWLLADAYAYMGHVMGKPDDLDFAAQLFRESVFYYGVGPAEPRSARTPLGLHYLGSPVDMHAMKIQAFTGRYGQLFMSMIEEGN